MAIVPRPHPVEPPRPAAAKARRPARWRRWLGVAFATLLAVVIATAVALPTDAIVRAVIAKVTPASGPFLVFRRAVLRPWGLRLDEPALRKADGTVILSAQWLRVRPSFWGLLRDRTGRPWQVASAICGGTVSASVDPEPTSASIGIDATWNDVDLGACLPPLGGGMTLAGHATGHGTARAGRGNHPTGQGELQLRDAVWRHEGDAAPPGLDVVHADTATVRVNVDDERLQLEGVDVRGPELELTGGGTMRITGSPRTNALDLRFTIVPGPAMSEDLGRIIDRLPPAPGSVPSARSLVVRGTTSDPKVVTRDLR